MTDIGASKADRAAVKLKQINPDITVTAYSEQLTNLNALALLAGFDIIVDASDNFPTRYMVNDACVLLNKPLVYGAVSRFEGQVAVWNAETVDGHRTANYRDLFPVPPAAGAIPNCAEAGVLGVLPGIIGSVQAGEVIKLITHIGNTLANQLQSFNWLNNEWFTCEVTPLKITETFLPSDVHAFQQWEYGFTINHTSFEEINYTTFNRLLTTSGVSFIDVRESGEQPIVDDFAHLHIPLGQLREKLDSVKEEIIVFFCQSGKRSKVAARLTAECFGSKKIYSLQHSIAGWKQQNQLQ
jgi:adenylyltransferase/sulfurtransferase